MTHLELLKSLGVNTRNLKSNAVLYKGGTSNVYSYKGSSVSFCRIDNNMVIVNTKYYSYTKKILRHNKIIRKRITKTPQRIYDMYDFNIKPKDITNIHHKINYNIMGYPKLKYQMQS